LSLRE